MPPLLERVEGVEPSSLALADSMLVEGVGFEPT